MKMIKYITALMLIAGIASASTNEITYKIYLKVSKDNLDVTEDVGTKLQQMTGTRFHSYIIPVTTTNTAVTKGAVGNLGNTESFAM